MHTHMQQEGGLKRRRLSILVRPLESLNDGIGPGYVASEREAEEAEELQRAQVFSFQLLFSGDSGTLHDGGQDPEDS